MNICIIGTGYVGLVAAACFAEMGNDVWTVDVNPQVIDGLKNGKVPFYEPGLEPLVRRNFEQGRLRFTTDLGEALEDALFVFNCVGTPPNHDGSCDLSYVYKAAADVGRFMNEYKIVVNKSTVPVGTAEKVRSIIESELRNRGLNLEFDVVSNPEFLKEGDAINDFLKPDRVIVGTDNIRTAKLLETLYSPYARTRDKMIVMSIRSAELTKYAANCMLAAKISYMNEIANICERVGADVSDIRAGIGADHRIGYHFIFPGVGYGGSCFPKDVKALITTARESGYEPQLIAAIDEVNIRQKQTLVQKIKAYFQEIGGVRDKVLALWGLSFKANTDDIREAPAIHLIEALTQEGMQVRAYDPAAGPNARELLKDNPLAAVLDRQYAPIEKADALAVMTDWNQFRNPDFDRIKSLLRTPLLFDGRNLYSPSLLAAKGFVYFSIGRSPVLENDWDTPLVPNTPLPLTEVS